MKFPVDDDEISIPSGKHNTKLNHMVTPNVNHTLNGEIDYFDLYIEQYTIQYTCAHSLTPKSGESEGSHLYL